MEIIHIIHPLHYLLFKKKKKKKKKKEEEEEMLTSVLSTREKSSYVEGFLGPDRLLDNFSQKQKTNKTMKKRTGTIMAGIKTETISWVGSGTGVVAVSAKKPLI